MQPRLSWGCSNALQDERQASRALSPRTSICSNPKPRTFCFTPPGPPGKLHFFLRRFLLAVSVPGSYILDILRACLALFPVILAFWVSFWPFGAFISFHFGLLGLHFLSFWPFGPSFPFILAFWAFICFHISFILVFWAFVSFFCVFKKPLAQICHPSLSKMVTSSKQIQPKNCLQKWTFWPFWPLGPSFPFILAFWVFVSFHFGLLGLHFFSFWPFGLLFPLFWPFRPSFPFVLAFWAFISFHFGLLGFHFLSFWPFGPSFPFILAFWAFISFHFGHLGLHFLTFWPFGASFPFLLAFWAVISFHFGLLGFHLLSFWSFGPSFPFILAFWAFISFDFLFAWAATWGPPHKLPKTGRFLIKFKQILSAARPAVFSNF